MSSSYLEVPDESPISNYKIKLPKKAYQLRCVKAEFGRSKVKQGPNGEAAGNNPMITRDWEVVSPETVKVLNEEKTKETGVPTFDTVNIAGLSVRDWLTMTPKTAFVVKADSLRLGVEPPDDEQPVVSNYIGKTASAILRTKVDKDLDEETKEPIMLPNGEVKITYQHQLAEWLG